MIRMHRNGTLLEFADADAIKAHFDLDVAPPVNTLKSASDAGWPLHVGIDPYILEMTDRNALVCEATNEELRAEMAQLREDI